MSRLLITSKIGCGTQSVDYPLACKPRPACQTETQRVLGVVSGVRDEPGWLDSAARTLSAKVRTLGLGVAVAKDREKGGRNEKRPRVMLDQRALTGSREFSLF